MNHVTKTTQWDDPRVPTGKRQRSSDKRAKRSTSRDSSRRRDGTRGRRERSYSPESPAKRSKLDNEDDADRSPLRITNRKAASRSLSPRRRYPSPRRRSPRQASPARHSPIRKAQPSPSPARRYSRSPRGRRSPSGPHNSPQRAGPTSRSPRCSPARRSPVKTSKGPNPDLGGLALHPYVQAQLDELFKTRRLHRSDLDEQSIQDLGEFTPGDAAIIIEAFSQEDFDRINNKNGFLTAMMRKYRDGRWDGMKDFSESVKQVPSLLLVSCNALFDVHCGRTLSEPSEHNAPFGLPSIVPPWHKH